MKNPRPGLTASPVRGFFRQGRASYANTTLTREKSSSRT